jgi:DNA-binding SARP family transcriptional activator
MNEPLSRVLRPLETQKARFHLRCWGTFSLYDRLSFEDCSPRGRKARAIIAYLATQRGASVSRERLAGILWTDRGDQQARASLRQTLFEFARTTAAAPGLLVIERDHLRVAVSALTSDVGELETLAGSDDVEALAQALAKKGDRLFDGLDGLDPAFDEWLATERRLEQERLSSLCAAAAERGLKQGGYAAVSQLATALQALDGTDETAAQLGMQADHARGDPSSLRRRHRQLCEALKHDLGVRPSVETETLFRQLDAADQVSGAAAAPAVAPAELQGAVAPKQSSGPTPSRPPLRFGVRAAFALVAAIAAIAVVSWAARSWLSRPVELATPEVAIRPMSVIGADPALKSFAERAADQIAGFLGDSEVRLVSADQTAGGLTKAPLTFGGAVTGADGELRLRLTLDDSRSGETLWSRDYTEPAQRGDALIGRAEGGAMEVINLVRMFNGPSGPLLDSETTRLALRSMDSVNPQMSLGLPDELGEFERALARRPDSGFLRAIYAQMLVAAVWVRPPADRAELFRRARTEAERTIREHPDQAAHAYQALLMIDQISAPQDLAGAEARLDAALKKFPEEPYLAAMKCSNLLTVGRAEESLFFCRHALALRPHTPLFLLLYAQALDLQGYYPSFADQALAEGARLYPDFQLIRIYRYAREAFAGSPDKAIALTHDPDAAPPITAQDMVASDLLQKARKSGAVADGDAAMAAMRSAEEHVPASDFRVLFPMALGRMDEAFGPDITPVMQQEPDLLPLAFAARLRSDRRYWPLAARAGLVRYWLMTNKWPDFCKDPSYPLDCRAEARRVASIGPTS